MKVAVLADTHMPKGDRRLPDASIALIAGCEALIHVGDFSTASVLDELRAIGPPVHAVHGNVDDAELHAALPEELIVDLDGRRVALIHDSGARKGRLARLRRRFPDAEAVIFGHSHTPEHLSEDGFQVFNPGSPTERRRAPERTMGLLHVDASGLDFELLALREERGAIALVPTSSGDSNGR